MNTLPISQAKDADLRLSQAAIERAALRARQLAAQTGTELIVSRNGVIERIKPQEISANSQAQEPPAPFYAGKP